MQHAKRIAVLLILGFDVFGALPAEAVKVITESRKESIPMQSFGTRLRFASGEAVRFPDFDLNYLGSRLAETNPAEPHAFVYHDFEMRIAKETARVSCPSDAGATAPVSFTFAKQMYVLELGRSILSDKVLANDELVLWPAGMYRAADVVGLLLSWRSDVSMSEDRRDDNGRTLMLMVPEGEVVVRVTGFKNRAGASEHFDGVTNAHTLAGTNPRVAVPDGLLWANRAAAGYPVVLWHAQTVYEVSGALPLRERVRLARWLAHEMAGEYRAIEVPDETTLWLLLGLKALPDLRHLPEAEAAEIKRGGTPYRQSTPSPADHACKLHDRTARGYHMVAGGKYVLVTPATKTELRLDNLELHRIERHGQRFRVEQARILELLP